MERKKAKRNQEEKFAAEAYNTKSLMEAYTQLTDPDDLELAEELSEGRMGKGEKNPNQGGLMHTYAQVMDSYREGTIEQEERQ